MPKIKRGITLKDYIAELQSLAADETVGETIEVVAIPPDLGESYTPTLSVGIDKDGKRRLFVL